MNIINDNGRLTNILEFVTTVQTGSFTAAGLQLGLTGSAVGKSVSRLEQRLGTKLLHRSTRRVTLTGEGAVYLKTCLSLLEVLEIAEEEISTGSSIPAGHVRLELPGAFGRRHVLPVINRLSLKHARLSFSIMFSERSADILAEGIDLAIRIGNLQDHSELVAKRLGVQRLVVCASPDYIARHGVLTNPEELILRDCITGWRPPGQHTWLLRDKNGQEVRYPVKARFEMSDGQAMVDAVLSGCGISQLPTWLIKDELAAGKLVTLLDGMAGAEMPIHAIWPKTPYPKAKIKVIVDELKKYFRESGLIQGD